MKRLHFFAILVFVFFSCDHEPNNTGSEPEEIIFGNLGEVLSPSNEYFDYANTYLDKAFHDSTRGHFSETEQHDILSVYISSGPITQTRTTIKVHNAKNELIYQHVFPTTELIYGYALDEIKSDEQMAKMIIYWAQEIVNNGFVDPTKLSEEHYLNQVPKEEFLNYGTYQKIKKAKRMILHYRLGEENHMYYGYSSEQDQVIQIIFCC